jgi:hypothetical protein
MLGSRGPDVKNLQELLNNFHPPSHLNVDGEFGPRTEAAVRVFQASIGIGIDGVAGPITLAALKKGVLTSHTVEASIQVNLKDAPWMAVAMREIGQKEIRGPEHNPRIIEYHAATTLKASTDETPWCSSFVNWCLRQVSIAGTNSAAAVSWIQSNRVKATLYPKNSWRIVAQRWPT